MAEGGLVLKKNVPVPQASPLVSVFRPVPQIRLLVSFFRPVPPTSLLVSVFRFFRRKASIVSSRG